MPRPLRTGCTPPGNAVSHALAYLKTTPLFWVLLAVAVAGALILAHFARQYAVDRGLRAHGVAADAEIVGVLGYPAASTRQVPLLELRFQDAQGATQRGRIQVDSSAYRVGERVAIRYRPGRPGELALASALESGRRVRDQAIMGLVGALMLLGCAIAAGSIAARALAVQRLLDTGVPTPGQVAALRQDAVGLGRRRPVRLEHRFVDARGQVRTGRSDPVPRQREPLYRVGSPVVVYYDPRRPERNLADVWGWGREAGQPADRPLRRP